MVACFLLLFGSGVLFVFFSSDMPRIFILFFFSLCLKVFKKLINTFQKRKKYTSRERQERKVCKFILGAVLAASLGCGLGFFSFFIQMNQDISLETNEYVYHFRGISDKWHCILPVFHSLIC